MSNFKSSFVSTMSDERRKEIAKQVSAAVRVGDMERSEEHTSELQSHDDLVCRLLLEKKKDASDL